MFERIESWWRRPAGIREVLSLALPLVISTLSWTLMIFTDRVFLVRYSQNAVAAALPAGMLAFVVICFPLGVATYVNTFVAQYQGAKRPERIGPVVWQALFIGFLSIPLAIATIPFAPALFQASAPPGRRAVTRSTSRSAQSGPAMAPAAAHQATVKTMRRRAIDGSLIRFIPGPWNAPAPRAPPTAESKTARCQEGRLPRCSAWRPIASPPRIARRPAGR